MQKQSLNLKQLRENLTPEDSISNIRENEHIGQQLASQQSGRNLPQDDNKGDMDARSDFQCESIQRVNSGDEDQDFVQESQKKLTQKELEGQRFWEQEKNELRREEDELTNLDIDPSTIPNEPHQQLLQSPSSKQKIAHQGMPSHYPRQRPKHPLKKIHRVDPIILRSIYVLFNNDIRTLCPPSKAIISIKPDTYPNSINISYTDKQFVQKLTDDLSTLIESINWEYIPTRPLLSSEKPQFCYSQKLMKKLSENKLGILKWKMPKDLIKNNQQFRKVDNVSTWGYFLVGRVKLKDLRNYTTMLKNTTYRRFSIFDYPDTRSHRLIVSKIVDTDLFKKDFLAPYKIRDIEVINTRKRSYRVNYRVTQSEEVYQTHRKPSFNRRFEYQKPVTNCLQILMSIPSNNYTLHPLLKDFCPLMRNFISKHFGVFAIVYRHESKNGHNQATYLPKIKVKGFQFEFVKEKNIISVNTITKMGLGMNQSYVYVFYEKQSEGINTEKSVRGLIQGLKELNVDFIGARVFLRFPTLDLQDLDKEIYFRKQFPWLSPLDRKNFRAYSIYIEANIPSRKRTYKEKRKMPEQDEQAKGEQHIDQKNQIQISNSEQRQEETNSNDIKKQEQSGNELLKIENRSKQSSPSKSSSSMRGSQSQPSKEPIDPLNNQQKASESLKRSTECVDNPVEVRDQARKVMEIDSSQTLAPKQNKPIGKFDLQHFLTHVKLKTK